VANVQVGIPVPVFNRNQGNKRAAEAEWIAACREVERIELDLQDRLAVAYRRYSNAFQQSERYSQKIVPKADRSLDLVTNGYEKGQVEYLTLLTAQQTYVQVTLAYINSLRELRTATAIIEGQLLSGSLRNPG
jgi:cobalt-zinc-cadmium efflux system outer membrane protein